MTQVSKFNKYLLITSQEPGACVWSPIPFWVGRIQVSLISLKNVFAFPSVEKMKVIITSFLKFLLKYS